MAEPDNGKNISPMEVQGNNSDINFPSDADLEQVCILLLARSRADRSSKPCTWFLMAPAPFSLFLRDPAFSSAPFPTPCRFPW